ncbi:MAG: DivIVA domain-containing protein [Runella sp.]
MKITPIEIRQHTFQRGLRGYDIEEVGAFLASLSNEWERVLNENKMLKMQLEIAEKELNKLREVELTMFRMLKTAEDTSAQMTEQAKTAAEKYIEEARQKAEELVNEARKKGNMLVVDAENQAKYVREEIMGEFKGHERDLKAMEKYRDNLIVQLKALANNTTDSIERFEKKFSQATVKEKIEELKAQVSQSLKANEELQQTRIEAEKIVDTIASEGENHETNLPVSDDASSPSEDLLTESTAAAVATQETPEQLDEATETATTTEATSDEEASKKKKNEEGSFFDQIS